MKATYCLFYLIFLVFFAETAFAQKPAIDSAAIISWPELNNQTVISNDGKYFLYNIDNMPVGSHTLIVKSTAKNTTEKKFLTDDDAGEFTADNKNAIINLTNDTLAVYNLKTGETRKISGVISHTLSRKSWLACMDKSREGQLTVYDPESNRMQTFTGVSWYSFDPAGKRLLLNQKITADSTALNLFDLESGKKQTIYRGTITGWPIFDDSDEKIAFFTDSKDKGSSLYIYHLDNNELQLLADNHTSGISDQTVIDANSCGIEEFFFNVTGDRLFFKLKTKNIPPKPKPGYIQVDVWNYKDGSLQPTQLAYGHPKINFLAVYNLDKRKLVQVETPARRIADCVNIGQLKYYSSSFVILEPSEESGGYRVKPDNSEPAGPVLYRLSLDNSSVIPIHMEFRYSLLQKKLITSSVSTTGRYLLYFNLSQKAWYNYDIETGLTKNITYKMSVPLTDEYLSYGATVPSFQPAGVAGWTKDDKSVLINDTYDIWKIDPLGRQAPVNLTAGYGLRHHIRFRLAKWSLPSSGDLPFISSDGLLLTAFDPVNKYNGFYTVSLLKITEPIMMTMGPFCYASVTHQGNVFIYSCPPVKARDTDIWITGRCSTDEAPNFFLTSDFKNFHPLTDFEPQKRYNWMTSELVNYKLPDGRPSQGLLLKPENFDPNKKYPIIFQFYQRESDGLYNYFRPDFNGSEIDIATYVSSGYLVFLTDMHFRVNEPGQSVVYSVESAVRYLEKNRSYVDSTKMAINGGSWGGYEVNCLVTHTHNFAAAAECCGVSDIISDYGSITGHKISEHFWFDRNSIYYHMSVNPWQRLDAYVKNSPVLSADKVTTPLLMLHNEKDPAVLFRQGEELFTALWELGKPVWMLQYDGHGHGVTGEAAKDFSKRLAQFFDYYLKNASPPVWMTRGVPAALKGIDSGLEYDTSGAKP